MNVFSAPFARPGQKESARCEGGLLGRSVVCRSWPRLWIARNILWIRTGHAWKGLWKWRIRRLRRYGDTNHSQCDNEFGGNGLSVYISVLLSLRLHRRLSHRTPRHLGS